MAHGAATLLCRRFFFYFPQPPENFRLPPDKFSFSSFGGTRDRSRDHFRQLSCVQIQSVKGIEHIMAFWGLFNSNSLVTTCSAFYFRGSCYDFVQILFTFPILGPKLLICTNKYIVLAPAFTESRFLTVRFDDRSWNEETCTTQSLPLLKCCGGEKSCSQFSIQRRPHGWRNFTMFCNNYWEPVREAGLINRFVAVDLLADSTIEALDLGWMTVFGRTPKSR